MSVTIACILEEEDDDDNEEAGEEYRMFLFQSTTVTKQDNYD